jgi:dynein heavy chain
MPKCLSVAQVVGNQENALGGANDGPLDEIRFWKSRTTDLSGIRAQLNRDGVRAIVKVTTQLVWW